MAEHISGSEDAFVAKMNEKAQVLGMKHTHFVNCCGLDADGHYTSARDIALMSRELITNHPDIFHYTTIWMENITHVTKRGESEFGLSNTNKLLRHYQGATGLKTGRLLFKRHRRTQSHFPYRCRYGMPKRKRAGKRLCLFT